MGVPNNQQKKPLDCCVRAGKSVLVKEPTTSCEKYDTTISAGCQLAKFENFKIMFCRIHRPMCIKVAHSAILIHIMRYGKAFCPTKKRNGFRPVDKVAKILPNIAIVLMNS